jgi:hypothetical protein
MGSRLKFITPLLVSAAVAAALVAAPTAVADPGVPQPNTIATAPTALTSHIILAGNSSGLRGGGWGFGGWDGVHGFGGGSLR